MFLQVAVLFVDYSDPFVKSESLFIWVMFPFTQREIFAARDFFVSSFTEAAWHDHFFQKCEVAQYGKLIYMPKKSRRKAGSNDDHLDKKILQSKCSPSELAGPS